MLKWDHGMVHPETRDVNEAGNKLMSVLLACRVVVPSQRNGLKHCYYPGMTGGLSKVSGFALCISGTRREMKPQTRHSEL